MSLFMIHASLRALGASSRSLSARRWQALSGLHDVVRGALGSARSGSDTPVPLDVALTHIAAAPRLDTLDALAEFGVPAFVRLDIPDHWGLPKGIASRNPVVHMTPSRAQLLKAILGEPPVTLFPAGAQGSGKSTATLLLACAAHSLGWPALYVPSAESFRAAAFSKFGVSAAAHRFLKWLRTQLVVNGRIPPYLQEWAASMGMEDWLLGRQSTVDDFETPFTFLWDSIGPLNTPFFLGIDEHNHMFEAALKLGQPSRQPLSDSIFSPLVRPWSSPLAQRPFISVLTGSSHSAFLGTVPFGEDTNIKFLPLADRDEVRELLEFPASPIQAGSAFLQDSAALSEAVTMIMELTGGNIRHVYMASNLVVGGVRALDPTSVTAEHMAQFERVLRVDLEGHWEAHATQAHARPMAAEVRESHKQALLHFVRSPNTPLTRGSARTFSDTFMDWGALTVDRSALRSRNPAVTFVSPIARSAVLRTWLKQAPLSASRVAFEQEILRLFGIRFTGTTLVLEAIEANPDPTSNAPSGTKPPGSKTQQVRFATGPVLSIGKPFERVIEFDVGLHLDQHQLPDHFRHELATQLRHATVQDAVLYFRTGDNQRLPGYDGFFFVPGTPPRLVCAQVTAGVDLNTRVKKFAAGHHALLKLHHALWEGVAARDRPYPISHFSCAGSRRSGVPPSLVAHHRAGGVMEPAAPHAWQQTLPVRVVLLLGRPLSSIDPSCWVKKLPQVPAEGTMIPIEVVDRIGLQNALGVSIPDQFI